MDMGQDELQEILEEFFTEADEGLDDLEQDLIKLESLAESGDTDADTVDRIFRTLHTLKGGAGFLGLERIAKLGHAGENLLDEIRAGKIPVDKDVMDNLLKTTDVLKELMEASKAGEDPSRIEIATLVTKLEELSGISTPQPETPEGMDIAGQAGSAAEPDVSVEVPVVSETPSVETPAEPIHVEGESVFGRPEVPEGVNADLLAEIQGDDRLDESLDKDNDSEPATAAPTPEAPAAPAVEVPEGVNADLLAEIQGDDRLDESLDKDNNSEPAAAAPAPETLAAPAVEVPEGVNADLLAEIQGDDRLDESLDNDKEDAPAAVAAPVTAPADTTSEELVLNRGTTEPEERRVSEVDRREKEQRTQGRRKVDVETTIRVETGRLDKVMNLVGELVLARNSLVQQLNQQHVKAELDKLANAGQIASNMEHLSRVTQDLQMSVLSTRMQPIKKVFDKIPRQVRELKNKLDKDIELIIEGEMTEVDKTLVEELADPMVHLIRNSLDHGIETPAEREAVGKSGTGSLAVRAFYEGNNVVVQVVDDGKGIDANKIRSAAVKKGLVDEIAARAMSDDEAVRLILKAGFSTAEEISDVSGRGVGMDVVNSKIVDIKGTVDIITEAGMGTTISIYLPLTLAIMQALLVSSHNEGFAIPIGDISEVIKFRPEDVHQVSNEDVIELRGEVLPLFYLHKLTKDGPLPKIDPSVLSEEENDKINQTPQTAAMRASSESENGYVVVVREATHNMGVVVDGLMGQEEAVVKPVTEMFEYNKAISGATITGDGTVHMILDIPFLMKETNKR